jgi:succinate dehydrogenase / fumarate reductase flavoprotein subunit
LTDRNRHFNTEVQEATECGHLLDLAQVLVEGALFRKESRGAHSRQDFPGRNDDAFLAHTFASRVGDSIRIDTRPVTISRFQPKARAY